MPQLTFLEQEKHQSEFKKETMKKKGKSVDLTFTVLDTDKETAIYLASGLTASARTSSLTVKDFTLDTTSFLVSCNQNKLI